MSLTVTPQEIVAAAEMSSEAGLLAKHGSWTRVELSEVADVLNGAPFSSRLFNNQGVGMPLIRIRDIGQDRTATHFSGDYGSQYIVRSGDFLVGMDGDFRVSVWRGPDGLLNQRVCKLSIRNKEHYDGRFLVLVLQGYLDAIWRETSSVTVKHLSSRTIGQVPLPLPPIAEQRRIVTRLDDYLSRIDAGDEAIARIASRQRSLSSAFLGSAIAGQTYAPGAGDADDEVGRLLRLRAKAGARTSATVPLQIPGYELPAGWGVLSLDTLSYDSGYGSSVKCAYDAAGIPVLRIPNIQDGRIDLKDLKYSTKLGVDLSRLFLDRGDLLFIRTNGSRDLIGRVGVVEKRLAAAFASYLIRFRLIPDGVDPWWVSFVMASPLWRRFVEQAAASSAGQYNLSLKVLGQLPVPIPPRSEQARLVAELQQMLGDLTRMKSSMTMSMNRGEGVRRAVLREAFTGRLVPQDPNDEPAIELLERIRAQLERTLKPKPRRRTITEQNERG